MKSPDYWKTYIHETGVDEIASAVRQATFTSRGLALNLRYFETDKQAPNILFIPATGWHAMLYADVCYQLHRYGYNVFCFDFQGHGDSEGRRGDFTISELVENSNDAAGFIAGHFNDRIGVVGFSLGGLVAFYCALSGNYARSVSCQNPGMLNEKEFSDALLIRKPGRLLLPYAHRLMKLVPGLKVPISLYLDWNALPADEDKDVLNKYLKDPDTVKWYTVRATASQVTTPPPGPLDRLSVPTRFVIPKEDRLLPASYVKGLYARLPKIEKELLETEGGHFALMVHPRRSARELHEWFNRTL